MILIGILTYIVVVILSILTSSSLSVFLNVPSLILVIGGIVSIIIITKSFNDIIYSLKNVINEKLPIDKERLSRCIHLYKLLFLTTLANGGIGLIIGWVSMLSNLDDPSTIGPAIAVSLTSIFYSLLIAFFIILPIKYILQKKQLDYRNEQQIDN